MAIKALFKKNKNKNKTKLQDIPSKNLGSSTIPIKDKSIHKSTPIK